MKLPDPVAFLEIIAQRRCWDFTLLDPHSGYLCAVSNGHHRFLSGAGKVVAYPLNNATAVSIAADKTHTAVLAERAGIKVPHGEHFFTSPRFAALRGAGKELPDAQAYAASVGYPVFVKPNDGSCGAFADIAYSADDIARQFAAMAERHPVAVVQAILRGPEYRIFAVDGVPRMAYERQSSGLAGDGASTVAALLDAYDDHLIAHGMTPVTLASPFLRHQLALEGMTPDSVLDIGRTLTVSPRRNISAGAAVNDFRQTFSPAVSAWVATITAAIGLRVCGIDVIATTGFDDPAGFTLLEVNGNPSLSGAFRAGHQAAVLAVWEDIADTWFAEAART